VELDFFIPTFLLSASILVPLVCLLHNMILPYPARPLLYYRSYSLQKSLIVMS
jgi:hypothetical protein